MLTVKLDIIKIRPGFKYLKLLQYITDDIAQRVDSQKDVIFDRGNFITFFARCSRKVMMALSLFCFSHAISCRYIMIICLEEQRILESLTRPTIEKNPVPCEYQSNFIIYMANIDEEKIAKKTLKQSTKIRILDLYARV